MRQLRRPRFWLGIAVSAVALYLALRGVSLGELARELGQADYRWLLPAAVVVVVGQLARAQRWRVLFGNGPRPTFRDSFAILSIGYFVSNILPLRLGDPLRAWLVESRAQGGGAEALATVLVERAIDFLTIAIVLSVWVPEPASRLLEQEFGAGRWGQPAVLRALTLALVAAVWAGWAAISLFSERAGRLATRSMRLVGVPALLAERLGGQAARFAAGFAPLRRLRTSVEAALWCLAVWWLGGLASWLVMKSFHIDLPFAAAMFVLCATALFAILPASPGYVGTFHYAIRQGLILYAGMLGTTVHAPTAVSYAIVLHGVTMLLLVLLGLVGMWLIGVTGVELGARLERTTSPA